MLVECSYRTYRPSREIGIDGLLRRQCAIRKVFGQPRYRFLFAILHEEVFLHQCRQLPALIGLMEVVSHDQQIIVKHTREEALRLRLPAFVTFANGRSHQVECCSIVTGIQSLRASHQIVEKSFLLIQFLVAAALFEKIVECHNRFQLLGLSRHHAAIIKAGNLSNDIIRVIYVVLDLIDNHLSHKMVDIQQFVHHRQKTCIGSQRHPNFRITRSRATHRILYMFTFETVFQSRQQRHCLCCLIFLVKLVKVLQPLRHHVQHIKHERRNMIGM